MRRNIDADAAVRTLILFALSLAVVGFISLFCSCRTCRPSETDLTVLSGDSLREKTVYVETLRIDTVTVTVEIPAQSAERTGRDSTSHLETDFAVSDAWLTSDGSLGHYLRNKTRKMETDIQVAVKDTYLQQEKEKIRKMTVRETRTVRITAGKPLKRWQKGLMWCGGGGIVIVSGLCIFTLCRFIRNKYK